ncbi:hypothetical protein MTO96_040938, partial [Rhipicephalus appendiculatus]
GSRLLHRVAARRGFGTRNRPAREARLSNFGESHPGPWLRGSCLFTKESFLGVGGSPPSRDGGKQGGVPYSIKAAFKNALLFLFVVYGP